MPTEEAGYTYAVEPTATNRLLANEEESIYGRSVRKSDQPILTPVIPRAADDVNLIPINNP
jgi:hypothetical protein